MPHDPLANDGSVDYPRGREADALRIEALRAVVGRRVSGRNVVVVDADLDWLLDMAEERMAEAEEDIGL